MSTTLTIDRFHARYRLPASRVGERARMDRVLADLASEALQDVVDRAGIDPHALVCIRRLEVPVTVRLGASDQAVAGQWADAFAEALEQTVGDGAAARDDEIVVQYPTRLRALVDVGANVARGDLRRAWAWTQLGLWPTYGPTDGVGAAAQFGTALASEPTLVVGVVVGLAKAGALDALVDVVAPATWAALADLALTAAGAVSSDGIESEARAWDAAGDALDGRDGGGVLDAGRDAGAAVSEQASRGLERSPLRGALARAAAAGSGAAPGLTVLALLAGEPTFALGPAATRRAVVRAAPDAARGGTGSPADLGAAASDPNSREHETAPRDAAVAPQAAPGEPRVAHPETTSRPGGAADASGDGAGGGTPALPGVAAANARSDASDGAIAETAAIDDLTDLGAEASQDADAPWVSAFGGLLLFLGTLDALDVAGRAADDPRLARHPFRAVLAALGTALAPGIPAGDPALAAFCGLASLDDLAELTSAGDLADLTGVGDRSAATLDGAGDDRAPIDARAAVADLAALVTATVAGRLGDDADELPGLHRRDARIAAEPGWTEARFDAGSATVATRRAGLDLDPDWLPWLGAVVKFIYD